MTLLFFLRSPAGNTDTGQAPDVAPLWDYSELEELRQKRKKKEPDWAAIQKLTGAVVEAEKKKKRRKRKDEEILLMFMQEMIEDD